MSIKPLDLQTLFLKMANVGKEQAAIQKSVENQQNREANQLIKEENNRDHSVNKAEEDKETDSVRDREGGSNRNNSESGREKEEEEASKNKANYFTDPKRGHNIDISG